MKIGYCIATSRIKFSFFQSEIDENSQLRYYVTHVTNESKKVSTNSMALKSLTIHNMKWQFFLFFATNFTYTRPRVLSSKKGKLHTCRVLLSLTEKKADMAAAAKKTHKVYIFQNTITIILWLFLLKFS